VSEGAGENLFVIKDGVIYTPDLSAGALNGITRNTVMHICKDLGLELVQKRITRDEVYICDEAFFTGTAAEVTPIRELDRIETGQGRLCRLAWPDHRKDPDAPSSTSSTAAIPNTPTGSRKCRTMSTKPLLNSWPKT